MSVASWLQGGLHQNFKNNTLIELLLCSHLLRRICLCRSIWRSVSNLRRFSVHFEAKKSQMLKNNYKIIIQGALLLSALVVTTFHTPLSPLLTGLPNFTLVSGSRFIDPSEVLSAVANGNHNGGTTGASVGGISNGHLESRNVAGLVVDGEGAVPMSPSSNISPPISCPSPLACSPSDIKTQNCLKPLNEQP